MATKKKIAEKMNMCMPHQGGCGGAIYGLGFVGALIFYVQTATGFWNGVLGVLKALIWPAMLVYKLLMG